MKRAIQLLHEYGWSLALLLALAIAYLLVERYAGTLLGAKDVVDAASKGLGTVLVAVGAVAGYHKYFKGRAFAERLKLGLSSRPVRWIAAVTDGKDVSALLHAVDLQVENAGTMTLWNPQLSLRVLALDEDREVALGMRSADFTRPARAGSLEGVEPGETLLFHTSFSVPVEVEVFRVVAELRASDSEWLRALTVANTFAPEKEQPKAAPAPVELEQESERRGE